MPDVLDWNSNRAMWIRVLEQQSGEGLEHWNALVRRQNPQAEQDLRDWLSEQSVSGYAANLLVMEYFGYPDFVSASADDLVAGQYADRTHLRPVYDAIIAAASELGEITIQARKSYVSLLTPRRTFARIRPSTKNRLDVALRLAEQEPAGRLLPSKIHQSMSLQLSMTSLAEVDQEVLHWLRQAFDENS
jgi:hypothetical protein